MKPEVERAGRITQRLISARKIPNLATIQKGLQNYFRNNNRTFKDGTPDGKWGEETYKAVKAWQADAIRNNYLAAKNKRGQSSIDGVYGPATHAATLKFRKEAPAELRAMNKPAAAKPAAAKATAPRRAAAKPAAAKPNVDINQVGAALAQAINKNLEWRYAMQQGKYPPATPAQALAYWRKAFNGNDKKIISLFQDPSFRGQLVIGPAQDPVEFAKLANVQNESLQISKKKLLNMIQEELKSIFSEELSDGMVRDPISPSGQMVSPEELINDIKAGMDLCYSKLESPEEIDYELVILLGNALKRVQALTGEEYP